MQVVLVDGIPLSSCTAYRYLCGIFLDDISTREQFAFLVYCYRVKAIFHNLRTVLYWRLCGLKIAPLLNTLSTEADVHGAQKVLSNNGFRMANCFCCLSQNVMVCLAHCRQELQQKSWETARLFLQDRDQDQDQMFKTKTKTAWSKTKTKTHFCPRGASRPRPCLED